MSESEWFALNRASWNARTPVHLRSRFYEVEAFKAGKSSLKPVELEQVGDVHGKSLLHLQCHFGQDTLSWARLGARVTGLDLSDVAIAAARALASELVAYPRPTRSIVGSRPSPASRAAMSARSVTSAICVSSV